jgi:hypothetical protein
MHSSHLLPREPMAAISLKPSNTLHHSLPRETEIGFMSRLETKHKVAAATHRLEGTTGMDKLKMHHGKAVTHSLVSRAPIWSV